MNRLTMLRLVLRSLQHHRVAGMLVAFGIAVATTCIAGSLLIGSSMEGSLRDQALQRLGRITDALVSPFYHRDERAHALEAPGTSVSRAVILQGVVERSATAVVVSKVSLTGVDPSFWSLFLEGAPVELEGRRAAVNRSLARDLGLRDEPGPLDPPEDLVVTLAREGGARAGTLFAHQRADKTQRKLRIEVAQVVPDACGGHFALRGSSNAAPRNLFVARNWLAQAIGQPERFNALLIERSSAATEPLTLQQKLQTAARLEDVGLRLVPRADQGYVSVESAGVVLPARQVERIATEAERQGLRAACTSIYLANSIAALDGDQRESAYALVAGTQMPTPLPFQKGGGPSPGLDEIWLTEWLAQDLNVDIGARVRVVFPVPSWDGALRTEARELMVRGIVALREAAADPGWAPSVEGITEAKSIDAWSLPFPIESSRITPRDDAFWEKYRTTPKAYVSLDLLKQLWSPEAHGADPEWVTSIRIAPPHQQSLEPFVDSLDRQLAGGLSLKAAGVSVRPVRDEALAGARGNTDFSQLFLGLSFFIVLAALGLSASLLRLQAQRRAGASGLLLATGFTARQVGGLLLLEGAVWSLGGALLGILGGLGYGALLIRALNGCWSDAVGGTALRLHIDAWAPTAGGLVGVVAGLAATWRTARGLLRRPAVDLLSGWSSSAIRSADQGRRWTCGLGLFCAVLALVLIALSMSASVLPPTAAFFAAGGLLLLAALLLAHAFLSRAWRRPLRPLAAGGMALRSAALFRGRSLLVVGLIAAASFVLVAVASQRRDPRRMDVTQRDSGSGGFVLRADTALPVRYDLGTVEGRRRLGFSADEEHLFADADVVSLWVSPGDEISCLNMARPAQPRLLGVGERMMARGGFHLIGAGTRGWTALVDTDPRAIPIFGDAASVQWTLHSGVGQEYPLAYGTGVQTTRFAGVLPGSIFAGELLMAEVPFRKLYPQVDAPTCFLVAVGLERETAAAAVLRRRLAPYGGEVRSTREILAGFLSVQNTYLSVFLALGGLGLLLGTVGLVTVLVRNVHERRAEWALLSATGFSHRRLAGLVSLEYIALLATGLAIGTVAALIAVWPAVRASDSEVNVWALTGMLAGVLLVGILVCAIASRTVIRGHLMAALRRE